MALNINIPSQVVQVANYAALPATGAINKIYITIDTELLYRWTGSAYAQIGGSDPEWGNITGTLSNQTDLQNALDAKVPYTGAIANVDLGEYELKAGQIELDQSPTGTAGVAVTRWNNTQGLTETTLKGGNVVLKNGSDLVARVVNNMGIQLTKAAYQVVKISGAQGQRLAVGLAQANNDNNSADTLGVVIETIANNQEGFVMTVGQIEDVNTTGSLQSETWNDGDVLYLSPTVAGRITNVKPNGSTGHIVVIGYVEYAHANHGKIYVKIMNGWELDELHNVYINPSTQANNDALIYDSATQLWKNKTIPTALGYTPANQTTTISTSSPLSGGGDLSANRTLSIADAVADGTTKGAATFTASDFNSASGVISIDYDNGQSASSSNKGFLTSADWSTFNAKQDALVSGTNIKTLEGQSLLGSGNIDLSKSDVGLSNVDNTSDADKPISTSTQTALNAKQDTLVSGTNIKTVNGNSLLGSGNVAISGLTYFTEAQNTAAPNATVYVDSLTAVSSTTDADFAIIPKGNGAILRQIPDGTATGGNKRGANAIDLQYSRTLNTQVASGTGAICFGNNNYGAGTKVFCVGNDNNAQGNNSYLFGNSNASTATYDYGTAFGTANQVQRRSSFASGTSNIVTSRDGAAFGDSNSITADYAFAFGGTNTASSSYAFATGIQNTASSPSSFAVGRNANTFGTRSKFALSGGQEATRGDAQFGMVVLKNRTTNATTTRLYIETVGAVTSTQIYPAANGAYRFKGSIIGKQTGTTNVAAWDIDGIIVKGATDASVTLAVSTVTLVQNTPAWGTPTLTADTVTIPGTLNISVTGAAATNIQWVCSVQTTEVIY